MYMSYSCQTSAMLIPTSRTFPVEITDAIIDEIASLAFSREDRSDTAQYRQTLLSFHAASSDCRQRALRYLFRSIYIEDARKGKTRITAIRYLMGSPILSRIGGIARHIKTVYLKFHPLGFSRYSGLPILGSGQTRYRVEDFLEEDDLAFVLAQLQGNCYGLEKFALYINDTFSRPSADECVDWMTLNPKCRSALQSLICSPRLKSLIIKNVAHLPIRILEGSQIKNLLLHLLEPDFGDDTNTRIFESKRSMYPMIEGLDIDCAHLFPKELLTAQSMRCFKELTVRASPDGEHSTILFLFVENL